jgi:hypothetical protein
VTGDDPKGDAPRVAAGPRLGVRERAKRRLEMLTRGAALFITATAGPPNAGCDIMPPPPDCADVPRVRDWGRATFRKFTVVDAGTPDGGVSDGGASDGGVSDGGVSDGGVSDAGALDAGSGDDAVPQDGDIFFVARLNVGFVNIARDVSVTGANAVDVSVSDGGGDFGTMVTARLVPTEGASELIVVLNGTCHTDEVSLRYRIGLDALADDRAHDVNANDDE